MHFDDSTTGTQHHSARTYEISPRQYCAEHIWLSSRTYLPPQVTSPKCTTRTTLQTPSVKAATRCKIQHPVQRHTVQKRMFPTSEIPNVPEGEKRMARSMPRNHLATSFCPIRKQMHRPPQSYVFTLQSCVQTQDTSTVTSQFDPQEKLGTTALHDLICFTQIQPCGAFVFVQRFDALHVRLHGNHKAGRRSANCISREHAHSFEINQHERRHSFLQKQPELVKKDSSCPKTSY